jgi:hypothetical protein
MKIKDKLIRFLLLASGIIYFWAIISVGLISVSPENPNKVELKDESGNVVLDSEDKPILVDADPPVIEEFFLTTISLIGTALAIHTGTILGIEIEQPTVPQGEEQPPKGIFKKIWNSKFITWVKKIITSFIKFDLNKIPEVATVLYISGLVIGVIFYFIESRSPASAELLKTSWSSLLGLLAGVWAAKSDEE